MSSPTNPPGPAGAVQLNTAGTADVGGNGEAIAVRPLDDSNSGDGGTTGQARRLVPSIPTGDRTSVTFAHGDGTIHVKHPIGSLAATKTCVILVIALFATYQIVQLLVPRVALNLQEPPNSWKKFNAARKQLDERLEIQENKAEEIERERHGHEEGGHHGGHNHGSGDGGHDGGHGKKGGRHDHDDDDEEQEHHHHDSSEHGKEREKDLVKERMLHTMLLDSLVEGGRETVLDQSVSHNDHAHYWSDATGTDLFPSRLAIRINGDIIRQAGDQVVKNGKSSRGWAQLAGHDFLKSRWSRPRFDHWFHFNNYDPMQHLFLLTEYEMKDLTNFLIKKFTHTRGSTLLASLNARTWEYAGYRSRKKPAIGDVRVLVGDILTNLHGLEYVHFPADCRELAALFHVMLMTRPRVSEDGKLDPREIGRFEEASKDMDCGCRKKHKTTDVYDTHMDLSFTRENLECLQLDVAQTDDVETRDISDVSTDDKMNPGLLTATLRENMFEPHTLLTDADEAPTPLEAKFYADAKRANKLSEFPRYNPYCIDMLKAMLRYRVPWGHRTEENVDREHGYTSLDLLAKLQNALNIYVLKDFQPQLHMFSCDVMKNVLMELYGVTYHEYIDLKQYLMWMHLYERAIVYFLLLFGIILIILVLEAILKCLEALAHRYNFSLCWNRLMQEMVMLSILSIVITGPVQWFDTADRIQEGLITRTYSLEQLNPMEAHTIMHDPREGHMANEVFVIVERIHMRLFYIVLLYVAMSGYWWLQMGMLLNRWEMLEDDTIERDDVTLLIGDDGGSDGGDYDGSDYNSSYSDDGDEEDDARGSAGEFAEDDSDADLRVSAGPYPEYDNPRPSAAEAPAKEESTKEGKDPAKEGKAEKFAAAKGMAMKKTQSILSESSSSSQEHEGEAAIVHDGKKKLREATDKLANQVGAQIAQLSSLHASTRGKTKDAKSGMTKKATPNKKQEQIESVIEVSSDSDEGNESDQSLYVVNKLLKQHNAPDHNGATEDIPQKERDSMFPDSIVIANEGMDEPMMLGEGQSEALENTNVKAFMPATSPALSRVMPTTKNVKEYVEPNYLGEDYDHNIVSRDGPPRGLCDRCCGRRNPEITGKQSSRASKWVKQGSRAGRERQNTDKDPGSRHVAFAVDGSSSTVGGNKQTADEDDDEENHLLAMSDSDNDDYISDVDELEQGITWQRWFFDSSYTDEELVRYHLHKATMLQPIIGETNPLVKLLPLRRFQFYMYLRNTIPHLMEHLLHIPTAGFVTLGALMVVLDGYDSLSGVLMARPFRTNNKVKNPDWWDIPTNEYQFEQIGKNTISDLNAALTSKGVAFLQGSGSSFLQMFGATGSSDFGSTSSSQGVSAWSDLTSVWGGSAKESRNDPSEDVRSDPNENSPEEPSDDDRNDALAHLIRQRRSAREARDALPPAKPVRLKTLSDNNHNYVGTKKRPVVVINESNFLFQMLVSLFVTGDFSMYHSSQRLVNRVLQKEKEFSVWVDHALHRHMEENSHPEPMANQLMAIETYIASWWELVCSKWNTFRFSNSSREVKSKLRKNRQEDSLSDSAVLNASQDGAVAEESRSLVQESLEDKSSNLNSNGHFAEFIDTLRIVLETAIDQIGIMCGPQYIYRKMSRTVHDFRANLKKRGWEDAVTVLLKGQEPAHHFIKILDDVHRGEVYEQYEKLINYHSVAHEDHHVRDTFAYPTVENWDEILNTMKSTWKSRGTMFERSNKRRNAIPSSKRKKKNKKSREHHHTGDRLETFLRGNSTASPNAHEMERNAPNDPSSYTPNDASSWEDLSAPNDARIGKPSSFISMAEAGGAPAGGGPGEFGESPKIHMGSTFVTQVPYRMYIGLSHVIQDALFLGVLLVCAVVWRWHLSVMTDLHGRIFENVCQREIGRDRSAKVRQWKRLYFALLDVYFGAKEGVPDNLLPFYAREVAYTPEGDQYFDDGQEHTVMEYNPKSRVLEPVTYLPPSQQLPGDVNALDEMVQRIRSGYYTPSEKADAMVSHAGHQSRLPLASRHSAAQTPRHGHAHPDGFGHSRGHTERHSMGDMRGSGAHYDYPGAMRHSAGQAGPTSKSRGERTSRGDSAKKLHAVTVPLHTTGNLMAEGSPVGSHVVKSFGDADAKRENFIESSTKSVGSLASKKGSSGELGDIMHEMHALQGLRKKMESSDEVKEETEAEVKDDKTPKKAGAKADPKGKATPKIKAGKDEKGDKKGDKDDKEGGDKKDEKTRPGELEKPQALKKGDKKDDKKGEKKADKIGDDDKKERGDKLDEKTSKEALAKIDKRMAELRKKRKDFLQERSETPHHLTAYINEHKMHTNLAFIQMGLLVHSALALSTLFNLSELIKFLMSDLTSDLDFVFIDLVPRIGKDDGIEREQVLVRYMSHQYVAVLLKFSMTSIPLIFVLSSCFLVLMAAVSIFPSLFETFVFVFRTSMVLDEESLQQYVEELEEEERRLLPIIEACSQTYCFGFVLQRFPEESREYLEHEYYQEHVSSFEKRRIEKAWSLFAVGKDDVAIDQQECEGDLTMAEKNIEYKNIFGTDMPTLRQHQKKTTTKAPDSPKRHISKREQKTVDQLRSFASCVTRAIDRSHAQEAQESTFMALSHGRSASVMSYLHSQVQSGHHMHSNRESAALRDSESSIGSARQSAALSNAPGTVQSYHSVAPTTEQAAGVAQPEKNIRVLCQKTMGLFLQNLGYKKRKILMLGEAWFSLLASNRQYCTWHELKQLLGAGQRFFVHQLFDETTFQHVILDILNTGGMEHHDYDPERYKDFDEWAKVELEECAEHAVHDYDTTHSHANRHHNGDEIPEARTSFRTCVSRLPRNCKIETRPDTQQVLQQLELVDGQIEVTHEFLLEDLIRDGDEEEIEGNGNMKSFRFRRSDEEQQEILDVVRFCYQHPGVHETVKARKKLRKRFLHESYTKWCTIDDAEVEYILSVMHLEEPRKYVPIIMEHMERRLAMAYKDRHHLPEVRDLAYYLSTATKLNQH